MNDFIPGRASGHRPKVTIRRMMIAVAVIAPFLLALREDAWGSFLAGVLIVVGSVICMAIKVFLDALSRFKARGVILGRWRKVRLALFSILFASTLIGAADCVFLFFYALIASDGFAVWSDYSPYWHINFFALFVGTMASWGMVLLAKSARWVPMHDMS
jgi:hypothetical protein